jgi:cytochrome c-type biogenesis protein CcmH
MSMLFLAIVITMASLALVFVVLPLTSGHKSLQKAILPVACLMLLLVGGMYSVLGTPSAARGVATNHVEKDSPAARSTEQTYSQKVGSVASFVDGLAARLQENPDDADGWVLLARSYRHLGQSQKAARAYARAIALGKTDVASEAALVSANDKRERPGEIRGRVSVAASAMNQVRPTDTVFVFAKAPDGSTMPVAAIRRPADRLPFEFVLNDRSSLTDLAKLSSLEQVTVTARVSRSGQALKADTNLIVQSDPVSVSKGGFVDLEISTDE